MSKPKIVFIDIETSPILGYAWQVYDTNILHIVEPVKILSFAWKWLDKSIVEVFGQDDFGEYADPELELVKEIWKVLDEADIVVAHNGDSFDCKVINARFIYHELTAPSEYKTVDTLKVAKKYFKFSSNSLDNLGGYLEEGKKENNGGFSTWLGCMKGDKDSWKRMKKYNAKDVDLLESVYMRLRPFIGNHPDLNSFNPKKIDKDHFPCSVCLSENTTKRGQAMTRLGKYQRYSCNDCGSWSKGPYQRRIGKDAEDEVDVDG